MRLSLALILPTHFGVAEQAWAADSIVVGHVETADFPSIPPCGVDEICLDAFYVLSIQVAQTVAGHPTVGSIKAWFPAPASNSTRSEGIFVLRPVNDATMAAKASFSVVESPPRKSDGKGGLTWSTQHSRSVYQRGFGSPMFPADADSVAKRFYLGTIESSRTDRCLWENTGAAIRSCFR
jgi:hypothetical protein